MTRKVYNIVFISVVAVLVVSLALSGFVIYRKSKALNESKATVTAIEADNKQKTEQISGLEKELEGKTQENEAIKSELNQANTEKERLQQENSNLKTQIETLSRNKNSGKVVATVLPQPVEPAVPAEPFPALIGQPVDVINPAADKICYLTFDDGPSPRTPEVLDILKRYNVKATFFVINSDSDIHYLKRIKDEGHAIGIHAYVHNYAYIYANQENYFADFHRISDRIFSVTGIRTNIMRFPGGSSNKVSRQYCVGIMSAIVPTIVNSGYAYFDWNVDSDDAGSSHSDYVAIANNVLNSSSNKSSICVLMHDSQAKTATVQALPYIIEGLAQRGFKFEALNASVSGFKHNINN